MARRPVTAPAAAPLPLPAPHAPVVEPRDLHWALHALVTGCSPEQYAGYQLPQLPKAPATAWSDGERPPARARSSPQQPIFGPLPGRARRA